MDWLRSINSVGILSPILAFALTGLMKFIEYRVRPRLVWGYFDQLYVITEAGGQRVSTRLVHLANQSGMRADAVEIAFAYRPQHYRVLPGREYKESISSDGSIFTIHFQELAPKEWVTIHLICWEQNELPVATTVRWKDGLAKFVQFALLPVQSGWGIGLLRAILQTIGAMCLAYLAIHSVTVLLG